MNLLRLTLFLSFVPPPGSPGSYRQLQGGVLAQWLQLYEIDTLPVAAEALLLRLLRAHSEG